MILASLLHPKRINSTLLLSRFDLAAWRGRERAWLCFWEKLFRGRGGRTSAPRELRWEAESRGREERGGRRGIGKGKGSVSWEQRASPESTVATPCSLK